jgi:hypothetical protein
MRRSTAVTVAPGPEMSSYRFRQWLADIPMVSLVLLKLCYSDSGRSLVHAEWRWRRCEDPA